MTDPACSRKPEQPGRCPDCNCTREGTRQLPRHAWILLAAGVLGALLVLLAVQKCG